MIPVCEPFLNGNELKYVTEAIKTNWVSSLSPKVKEFENLFAMWLYGVKEFDEGRAHATSTTNGTTALNLALHTLKIGGNYGGSFDDEVIIPDFTMIAVPNSVHWAGAKLVLCDVSYYDFRLKYDDVEKLITKNTKAIICTHTYGIPDDMDKLLELCRKYDLKLIEDCAEGLGATYDGKKIGIFGDISIFSFYANKVITTGEGGMLCSKDKRLVERAFYLKNHTFCKDRHFWHTEVGHNMRMTGLQAALGLAQLENIDKHIQKKRENARIYTEQLSPFFEKLNKEWKENNIEPYQLMPSIKGAVYWMYGVKVPFKQIVRDKLKEKGIETRSYFIPVHLQKPYLIKGEFYSSTKLYQDGFYLPSGIGLTKAQIKKVCDTLKKIIKKVDKGGYI